MLSFSWKSVAEFTLGFALLALGSEWSKPAIGDEPLSRKLVSKPSWTPDQGLVVHEWGTFTTFSGSDGVFLEFRPLADEVSDLPDFVWNRFTRTNNPIWFKGNLRGKVRMETPVLYFYANQTQDIQVKVDFPKGLLTEFYPPIQTMKPALDRDAALGEGELIGNSSLDWGRVTLLPIDQLAPASLDVERRRQIGSLMERTLVPHSADEAHYAKARDTDSALVFVHAQDKAGLTNAPSPHAGFAEKFLFYRGVGKFELPIRVTFDSQENPILGNRDSNHVSSAIMVRVHNQQIQASDPFAVAPNEQQLIPALKTMTKEEVMQTIQSMLTKDGLYDKEGAAMVATWEDSWLTEEGTRVLYIVPRSITDELLPLHLDPQPNELVRTLVGRMEILSPSDETKALLAVESNRNLRQQLAAAKTKSQEVPIPPTILKLGRMAEPTLARVAALSQNESLRLEAHYLISQLRQATDSK